MNKIVGQRVLVPKFKVPGPKNHKEYGFENQIPQILGTLTLWAGQRTCEYKGLGHDPCSSSWQLPFPKRQHEIDRPLNYQTTMAETGLSISIYRELGSMDWDICIAPPRQASYWHGEST